MFRPQLELEAPDITSEIVTIWAKFRSLLSGGTTIIAVALMMPAAHAASINIGSSCPAGPPAGCLASQLGITVNPVFQGGILRMNQADNTTYSQNFTLSGSGTNAIDTGTVNSNFSGVFSNVTSATGRITIGTASSTGSVTFSAINGYTGQTNILAGNSLFLSGSGSIASSSYVSNAGTFDISATTSGATIQGVANSGGTIRLGSKTLTIDLTADRSYSGAIGTSSDTDTGGLTISSTATPGFTQTLTGAAKLYSGATTINSGATLKVQSGGGIGASSGVIADGHFEIGNLQTIKSLSGSGTVQLNDKVLTLSAASGIFNGIISSTTDSGGLTIAGGSETLTGANTYSGATKIQSGATLQLDGSLASATTIDAGGTLKGTGTINNYVINNGAVKPGDSPGTLTINGNYTQGSGGALEIEIGGTGAGQFDQLVVNGAASFAGMMNILLADSYIFPAGQTLFSDVIQYTSHTGDFTGFSFNNTSCLSGGADIWECGSHVTITEMVYSTHLDLLVNVVPEPATLALLGVGLAGLGFARRRAG